VKLWNNITCVLSLKRFMFPNRTLNTVNEMLKEPYGKFVSFLVEISVKVMT